MSAELHERIRRERVEGALLGELLDRYTSGDVVEVLGIQHIAGSLGVYNDHEETTDDLDD